MINDSLKNKETKRICNLKIISLFRTFNDNFQSKFITKEFILFMFGLQLLVKNNF